MTALRKTLVLSGPPGVGKTTVARLVAASRKGRAHDMDALVETRTGRTPAELIRTDGESTLRREEALALQAVDGTLGDDDVMSLGGGTLTTAIGRRYARRQGPVVGLVAQPATLIARLAADSTDRPLADPARLDALLEARARSYAGVDATVSAEKAPDEVAREVLGTIAGARIMSVAVGEHATRLVLGNGIAATATAGAVAALAPERTVVIVTDLGSPAAAAIADAVARVAPAVRIELAGGEPSKTWAVLGDVLERAIAAGAGRQSVVVGIGGGAVCDLAGMVAGLLARGAPLVLVPTTILAQADAALGGKCAVDVGVSKNLVGLFHPARDVIVDPTTCDTQPLADRRAGLAEILKAGVIGDPGLFHGVAERGDVDLEDLARALLVKADIVSEDPTEQGRRKLLNLGHTLGHALEAGSGLSLRHGEAVAMGMAAAARMSLALGLCDAAVVHTLERALQSCGLPIQAEVRLLARAAPHLRNDKKGTSEQVDLVLIRQIGEVSTHRISWIDAAAGLLRAGGGE